ncbi:hypothetical protein AWW67_03565 [Roseivirga seohaensis]|uniref:DNA methylase N-4/N-6 domain-containing protein n=1 Tax=Roseivirga seohaensis TaxID=1914963 RepID=A0A150XZI3_9BACT|nr:site-specific DNA-methyltransferase [Roseivirga seohaensis]KYG84200.1 hypothetical protein AWW67_03565 [Roseivirga seohaensis]
MPTLNWIGKEKVVNHHRDVPFRVLEHKYHFEYSPESEAGENEKSLSAEALTQEGNMIIHGDNLEALKALLPKYEGKIKCIYIDPPYNTGNEGWVYNDNVNHPKIKKWLGDVVGKEGDDLTRHDKWLCMMYPRLKLLHRLLANDGAIFISIDDNEQANLKLICDEIFGNRNCIGPIIQNKMNAKNDTVNIQKNHEFILVYRKDSKITKGSKTSPTLLNQTIKEREVYEENGRYYFINDAITTRGEGGVLNARPNLGYTVYFNPETNQKEAILDYDIELAKESNSIKDIYCTDKEKLANGFIPIRPPKVRGKLGCWTWSLDKFNAEKDNIIVTGKKGAFAVKKRTFVESSHVVKKEHKLFYQDVNSRNSRSILDFSTNDGTTELSNIMDVQNIFDNPKNISMIEYLIGLIPNKDALILDSFAGSGTTAHAVMNLNKQDGGNRKFILVEMEDYAETITAERVKRVAKGYGEGKKAVEGTGGSFDYYTLGEPLFVGENKEYLNEAVGIEKIREYIWYSETRTALPVIARNEERMGNEGDRFVPRDDEPFYLGNKDQTAYYFFYEPQQVTTLDYDFLATIKTKAEQYVIYADNCLLSKAYMSEHNIIFKKIPRDISRF